MIASNKSKVNIIHHRAFYLPTGDPKTGILCPRVRRDLCHVPPVEQLADIVLQLQRKRLLCSRFFSHVRLDCSVKKSVLTMSRHVAIFSWKSVHIRLLLALQLVRLILHRISLDPTGDGARLVVKLDERMADSDAFCQGGVNSMNKGCWNGRAMSTSSGFRPLGELPECGETMWRLRGTLECFRRITTETFLDRLKLAVAELSLHRSLSGFLEVAEALDSIGSILRKGERDISGFLAGLVTVQRRVNVHHDEMDMPRTFRLADEDIEFLKHVGGALTLVADLLDECSAACRKHDLSIADVSSTVSRAAMVLSTQSSEFEHARVFVLRLIATVGTPGSSVGEQQDTDSGNRVQRMR
jgi:hypothetical protein